MVIHLAFSLTSKAIISNRSSAARKLQASSSVQFFFPVKIDGCCKMVVNHHESSEKQGEKGDNTNQYPHHNQASICSGVHMCLLNSDDDNDSGTQLLKWFWWALVFLYKRSIHKHPKTSCFMVSL